MKKRVRTLYRVSRKSQLKEDDIPMQRSACRAFLKTKTDWWYDEENSYLEKGISGFLKSSSDRDVIQTILEDAKNKEFDVLLVFLFDRIGRKEYDTPLIVKTLSQLGIEIWSVKEGEQQFKDHSDDLINYIRFWQASGESKKTSIRVKEGQRRQALKGEYHGGEPSYGFKVVSSNILNKDGKPKGMLVINHSEAEVIEVMFSLAIKRQYGSSRIAKHINKLGYRNRKGKEWTMEAVHKVLINPLVKGVVVSGKTTTDEEGKKVKQPESEWIINTDHKDRLQIISDEDYDYVQELMQSRKTKRRTKDEDVNYTILTKGEFLFSGIARCGYCGNKLYTDKRFKTVKNKTMKDRRYMTSYYRCRHKDYNKDSKCKRTYAKTKMEKLILEDVHRYIKGFEDENLINRVKKSIYDLDNSYKKSYEENNINLKKLENELKSLKDEVVKSLMGDSKFSSDLLGNLIAEKEEEVTKLKYKLLEDEKQYKKEKKEFDDLYSTSKFIPNWNEEFEKLDDEEKKVALSKIVKEVVFYRDKIEVEFKLGLKEFIEHVFKEVIN
ncbi:recombinase family protein [Oceanobacillus sp. FSL W8-0428]|uniref:recombinase family protein n=1 Tax=Oceanobacillus sp. FSL W8-0428 TaxID=2921715 RepID=UPI0030FD0270